MILQKQIYTIKIAVPFIESCIIVTKVMHPETKEITDMITIVLGETEQSACNLDMTSYTTLNH